MVTNFLGDNDEHIQRMEGLLYRELDDDNPYLQEIKEINGEVFWAFDIDDELSKYYSEPVDDWFHDQLIDEISEFSADFEMYRIPTFVCNLILEDDLEILELNLERSTKRIK